uniref:Mediator of RNA polymerase II transcription subunit 4 n=1 Tax=Acrobeloides nanus TaxID=290746 RepID=A0A914DDA6_9BILA
MELFLEKKKDTVALLRKVHAHKQREEYIRTLEKCVEDRNTVIESIMNELKLTEAALSEAVFQAGKKLKSVHQSEKHRVNSEEIIRFAHQISKSNSVAAPLSWQQGDPSRPFPTEIDFRMSALSNSRVQAPAATTPALSLLRQQSTSGSLNRSTSAAMLRGGVSPLPTGPYSNPLQPPSARAWSPSPRAVFTTTSPSPRGRQPSSSSGRISSPRQSTQPNILIRRPSQSPRMVQSPLTGPSPISSSAPTTSPAMNVQLSFQGSSKNILSTDNGDHLMSSDSSSSSSSDEAS